MNCVRRIEFGCIFKLHLQNTDCSIESVRLLGSDGFFTDIANHNCLLSSIRLLFEKIEPWYMLQHLNDSLLLVKIENLKEGCLSAVYICTDDGFKYYAKDIRVYGM